jgi:hypothetical protein
MPADTCAAAAAAAAHAAHATSPAPAPVRRQVLDTQQAALRQRCGGACLVAHQPPRARPHGPSLLPGRPATCHPRRAHPAGGGREAGGRRGGVRHAAAQAGQEAREGRRGHSPLQAAAAARVGEPPGLRAGAGGAPAVLTGAQQAGQRAGQGHLRGAGAAQARALGGCVHARPCPARLNSRRATGAPRPLQVAAGCSTAMLPAARCPLQAAARRPGGGGR